MKIKIDYKNPYITEDMSFISIDDSLKIAKERFKRLFPNLILLKATKIKTIK